MGPRQLEVPIDIDEVLKRAVNAQRAIFAADDDLLSFASSTLKVAATPMGGLREVARQYPGGRRQGEAGDAETQNLAAITRFVMKRANCHRSAFR